MTLWRTLRIICLAQGAYINKGASLIFHHCFKLKWSSNLYVWPLGKDSSKVTLRIHAIPPPDFLKPSRFHPQKNNVRTEWFTGVAKKQEGNEEFSEIISWLRQHTYRHVIMYCCHCYRAVSSEPATPHYNSTVLGDHLPLSHLQFLSAVSAQCPAFGDGVALLKVWLRQRELDQVRPHYFCMRMSFVTYVDVNRISDSLLEWFIFLYDIL